MTVTKNANFGKNGVVPPYPEVDDFLRILHPMRFSTLISELDEMTVGKSIDWLFKVSLEKKCLLLCGSLSSMVRVVTSSNISSSEIA